MVTSHQLQPDPTAAKDNQDCQQKEQGRDGSIEVIVEDLVTKCGELARCSALVGKLLEVGGSAEKSKTNISSEDLLPTGCERHGEEP